MVSKIKFGLKWNSFKNMVTFSLLSLVILAIITGMASAAITSITVTSPNGGEKWSGNKTINWTSSGSGDTVNIYYSTNDFIGTSILLSSGETNDGSYTLNTTLLSDNTNYKIKVRATIDFDVSDISNAAFTIDNTVPVISLVTPASSSFVNGTFAANYTLSEELTSGTIIFTRTGGSDDANSIHTYNLVGADLTSGAHSISRADLEIGFGNSLVNNTVYNMTVSAIDTASNAATPVINTNITYYDITPPNAPAITVPTSGATLTSANIWVNGTTDADTANVTVYVNGSSTNVSFAVTSGTFNISNVPLGADGSHEINVSAMDAVGNVNTTNATVTVTLDTTPPIAPTITVPTNGATLASAYTWVNGTIDANTTNVTVYVNNTATNVSVAVNSGIFNISNVPLGADGSHEINVSAMDAQGNVNTTNATVIVTVAIPPNAPTITMPTGNTILSYTWVNGTTDSDTANVTVYVNNVMTNESVAVSGNIFNISNVPLVNGVNVINVTAKDAQGNVNTTNGTKTISVDTIMPDVPTIDVPTNLTILTSLYISVNGTTDGDTASVTVYVNGTLKNVLDVNAGIFNISNVYLGADGSHEINVSAMDAAGNINTTNATVIVTVDTTAPTTPVVTDDGASTTNTTSLHASWTSTDAVSGIAEYFYAIGTSAGATNVVSWTSTGTTPNVTNSSLSLTVGTTYYFTVKVKDLAGFNSTAGNSNGIAVLHSSAAGTYDIELLPGWNLISLPLMPTNETIQDVTAGIQNQINISYGIWYYDPLSGWLSYAPGVPSDLTMMQAGKGYWIYMDSSTTLTNTGSFLPAGNSLPPEYSVYTGWNLIGIHAQTDKTASDYLANVGAYGTGWSSLFKYTAGQYNSISSSGTMNRGNGFWLYAPRNGTIIPN